MEDELEIKIYKEIDGAQSIKKNTAKKGSVKEDLIGQKFGRLVVISPAENLGGRTRWNCLCDCGKEKITYSKQLKNGKCKSCGCLHKENISKARRGKSFIGRRFRN